MRDSKSSLLLLVSLILFLMSFIILCTWGYNTYYKSKEDKQRPVVSALDDPATIAKATKAIADATRDSLQKVYAATIKELDSKLDSTFNYADSLKGPLDIKLDEFFKLRNDITTILKDKSSNANLGVARQKITELQRRVDELIGRNKDVEQENKRLYAMLKQLSDNMKEPDQQNVRPVVFENKQVNETSLPGSNTSVPAANTFVASDLRLSALMETDNNKELETSQALQTDKLVGSFIVKNELNPNNNAEVIIVVLQPNGQVLQKSSWESGTFTTREGRKIYSCKMRFDYNKGEVKRLNFSLSSDKYMKGNYIMQIYHNGTMIGKLSKTLS